MAGIPPGVAHDIDKLGLLAMSFRGTRDDAVRQKIAREYAQAVERLIDSGCWQLMPALEDQLPDDWMPQAFFDYWLRRSAP